MNEKLLQTRIILRNDNSKVWDEVKNTATLRPGEIGVESDTGLFKIGKTSGIEGKLFTWEELSYANSKPDDMTVTVDTKGILTLANIPKETTDAEGKAIIYSPNLVNGSLIWKEVSPITTEELDNSIKAIIKDVDDITGEIASLTAIIGTPAEPETEEGSGDAKPATGIFAAILAEETRAKQSEAAIIKSINDLQQDISNINHFKTEVVDSINDVKAEGILYLVKAENETYKEYLYVNGQPELIGDTSIDLSDYVKAEDLDDSISNNAVIKQIEEDVTNIQNTYITVDTANSTFYTKAEIDSKLETVKPTIEAATPEKIGGIKSSDGNNQVSVSKEGIATVNKITISSLTQDVELILSGGDASTGNKK